MSQFGRISLFAIHIVATALASLASAAANAEQAALRPILVLESISPTHLTLPYGSNLHFALYNDGQVIAHSKEYGKGLIYGRLDPADAERFRLDLAKDLTGVSGIQPSNPGVADDGVATLHIWNGQNYSTYKGSSAACFSAGLGADAFMQGIKRQLREHTDNRFLKVCDRLSFYEIASPQPWPANRAELLDVRPWLR